MQQGRSPAHRSNHASELFSLPLIHGFQAAHIECRLRAYGNSIQCVVNVEGLTATAVSLFTRCFLHCLGILVPVEVCYVKVGAVRRIQGDVREHAGGHAVVKSGRRNPLTSRCWCMYSALRGCPGYHDFPWLLCGPAYISFKAWRCAKVKQFDE